MLSCSNGHHQHGKLWSCLTPETAQVLACALLHDLGAADDGIRCGELAAFCVDPAFRGSGRGDSLLDYVEQVRPPAGLCELAACTPVGELRMPQGTSRQLGVAGIHRCLCLCLQLPTACTVRL